MALISIKGKREGTGDIGELWINPDYIVIATPLGVGEWGLFLDCAENRLSPPVVVVKDEEFRKLTNEVGQ